MPVLAPAPFGQLTITGQYAPSSDTGIDRQTYELYIENTGSKPVEFTSVTLNGEKLILVQVQAKSLSRSLDAFEIDGIPMSINENSENLAQSAPDNVGWWQFYPDQIVPAKGAAIFQVNFKSKPQAQQKLVLETSTGLKISCPLQRFRFPEKLITAITYSKDYSQVFIQYESRNGAPVDKVWLNGVEIKSFKILPARDRKTPCMLAIQAPFPISTGMPLHVKLRFADQDWRYALVRALSGIELDAAEVAGRPTRLERRDFSLDPFPPVTMILYDFTCADVTANDKGRSAMDLIAARLALYRKDSSSLAGISYCTAIYPEIWNIYGPLADAVYAKPYRLGYGQTPKRFFEEEEDVLEKAASTASPKPWIYIPESYKLRNKRLIEDQELQTLGWLALARGAKGIRYHYWKHPDNTFVLNKGLQDGLITLNLQISDVRDLLSPVAFVSASQARVPCRIPLPVTTNAPFIPRSDDPNLDPRPTADLNVKTYISWAGDKGMLVYVRNLDYSTDAQPDENGVKPRFSAPRREDIKITIPLPPWFIPGASRDLVKAGLVPCAFNQTPAGMEAQLVLPELEAFRVIWIENR